VIRNDNSEIILLCVKAVELMAKTAIVVFVVIRIFFLHFCVSIFRGVHSIDRWRQMPPEKSWGKWKIKNWGENFSMATCFKYRNMHNTKCDNSAILHFLLASFWICDITMHFLFLLLKLHWIWSVNFLQNKWNCSHQMS